MPEAAVHGLTGQARRLPGEDGIWVLIFGDMILFSVFFITFFVYRLQEYEVFLAGHAVLEIQLGMLNTLLLLTSSLFVAMATRAVRLGQPSAERWLAAAIVCGACFCLVKAVEYSQKISHGYTLTTNDFFTLYYMYTGIHLVHVLIGLGILVFLYRRVKRAADGGSTIKLVEGGASFWHLVDLLWIVMFALFYLVR